MIFSLSSKEFSLIKKYIEEKCGILISEDKSYLIESRLSKLLIDFKCSSFEEFYQLIYKTRDESITEKIIDAITTNETLWFRDRKPWDILQYVLLPKYINILREKKKNIIRIWSAGCSTGQEPYTAAMIIDDYLNKNGITDITLSQFEIIATDISGAILDIAKLGRYDAISIMRGLPEYYKNQYFEKQGRIYILKDSIKQSVKFYRFNLQKSFLPLGYFDLIFCRYVTIYFSEVLKKDILQRISHSLYDEGNLFLGSSELFFEYENEYSKKEHLDSIYYEVKR